MRLWEAIATSTRKKILIFRVINCGFKLQNDFMSFPTMTTQIKLGENLKYIIGVQSLSVLIFQMTDLFILILPYIQSDTEKVA